jgi:hypothetical protein
MQKQWYFLKLLKIYYLRKQNNIFKEVFKKNRLPLNPTETEELCKMFDVDQNSSKFDYVTFMKSISTGKSSTEINVIKI